MDDKQKVVRDPIHGNIKLNDSIVKLLESPEVQRLYNIKQLGFAHLVFPGANHTRLEHSLGAYFLANQISDALDIEYEKKEIVSSAALLHDIGHGPFSHTIESLLLEKFGVNHVDLTEELITGEYDIFESHEQEFVETQRVHNILSTSSVDVQEIINIIRGKTKQNPYLGQLLNSTIDVDQLDYLLRDAYYTGVAYGMIDIQRLLQTLVVHKGLLAVERKGVGVVESILMARGLMYSSVYFHKTVRIAELMLSKAIEMIQDIQPFEFFRLIDAELVSSLQKMGKYQQEIVTRLKYRVLFKQAYSASIHDLDNNALMKVKKLEDANFRRQKEGELEDFYDIPHGHLIIDIPRPELVLAEPRLNKTDIFVVDRHEIQPLDTFTPIAHAIRSRITPDWILMIITDEKYRNSISEKVEDILFG